MTTMPKGINWNEQFYKLLRQLLEMAQEFILYTTDTGNVSVQVLYEDGTFWLTQKRMAELFGVEVPTINYHLKEIFNSGELTEAATIRKIRIVFDSKYFLLVFQQKIFRIVCRFKKMHYLCIDKSRPLPIRTAYPAGHFLYIGKKKNQFFCFALDFS